MPHVPKIPMNLQKHSGKFSMQYYVRRLTTILTYLSTQLCNKVRANFFKRCIDLWQEWQNHINLTRKLIFFRILSSINPIEDANGHLKVGEPIIHVWHMILSRRFYESGCLSATHLGQHLLIWRSVHSSWCASVGLTGPFARSPFLKIPSPKLKTRPRSTSRST